MLQDLIPLRLLQLQTVVQTSLHHMVAEDDSKIWTYPQHPDVNKGGVFSADSPSDVKAGTFVGYQVPQELSVLPHSLLHIHFLLLRHTFMSWWATKDIQESDTDRHTDTVQSGARRHCQEVMKQLTLGWKMSFFILFLEQEFANFNTWRHLKGQTHGTDIELAAMNAVGCVALHLLHLSQRAAALERTTTATAGSQLAQTFCERKYLPTPPAGDSLYLSFKMGNRRL